MTRHRLSLLLSLLSLLLVGGLLIPGRVSSLLFASAGVAFPVALMALGACGPRGGLRPAGLGRRLAGGLVVLLVILELAAVAVLALSGVADGGASTGAHSGQADRAVLAATVQLVGLWLLPLPLVALLYALTFDRAGIDPDDLELLRRRHRTPGGGDRNGT